jgi:L-lactate dehydrogenase (cytochrome)
MQTFADEHPGGAAIIRQFRGGDATAAFSAVHPRDLLQRLGLRTRLCVGRMHDGYVAATATAAKKKEDAESSSSSSGEHKQLLQSQQQQQKKKKKKKKKPQLSDMLNTLDFESVAQQFMQNREGWAYYSSGAEDEMSVRENRAAFHRLRLRPRVLRDVSRIDTRCSVLGHAVAAPLYVTATALARLAHPDAERGIARACRTHNLMYMVPTLSSAALDDILAVKTELKKEKKQQQTLFFQLYVKADRNATRRLIEQAERGGCSALVITVDAPSLGSREKDKRLKQITHAGSNLQRKQQQAEDTSQGTSAALSQFIDPALSWRDLPWFASVTKLPIVLKGVQCGEDAVLAARHPNVRAIVVSNHGGRQLDHARSGIEMLHECVEALRAERLEHRLEIYMDGGVRRGSDIFKALCLGARSVGVGRPVLYALATYGQRGVERVLRILRTELELCMRLMGTPRLSDIRRGMIAPPSALFGGGFSPLDSLAHKMYEPLQSAAAAVTSSPRPRSRL